MTAALHEPVEYDKWHYFNYENVIFQWSTHNTYRSICLKKMSPLDKEYSLFQTGYSSPHP